MRHPCVHTREGLERQIAAAGVDSARIHFSGCSMIVFVSNTDDAPECARFAHDIAPLAGDGVKTMYVEKA